MTKIDATLNLILVTYIQLIDQDWLCILHPPDMLRILYTCYCHNRLR